MDPGTVAATAAGIEAIKESLDGLGSPGLLGALGKMLGGGGPISELLELAKNSQGITDASTAINEFVKNAKLFEEGVDIDDSVIEGIEKVVKALGSGNPAGLSAFDRAINSINGLDASKISLLQGIKIPQITPKTAAEYEKVFNAMQKNQPDLIDKVSSTLSRFFGSSERSGSGGTGGTGGSVDPATVGQGMAEDDVEGMEGAGMLGSAAKDVSTGGAVARGKMMLTSAQQKKLAMLRQRLKGAGKITKKKIEKDIRAIERKGRAAYNKSVNPNKKFSGDLSGSPKNVQAAAISSSPPAAAASAGGGGGNVSISAPTTNSSQSTSSYPITNRPNNPALDRIRNSLNF